MNVKIKVRVSRRALAFSHVLFAPFPYSQPFLPAQNVSHLQQGTFHPPFTTFPATSNEQPSIQQTSMKYVVNSYPRQEVNTYPQSTHQPQPLNANPVAAMHNVSSYATTPLQSGHLPRQSGQENGFHAQLPSATPMTSHTAKPASFSVYRDKSAAHERRRTKSRSAEVRSIEASQVAAQLKRLEIQRRTRVAEVKGGRMEGVEIAAVGRKSGKTASSASARGVKERSANGNAGDTSRSRISEVSLAESCVPVC